MRSILITCTTFLLTLSLLSCQQENSLLCDNGYLNSAGDNVDNCDCPPGYRPRISLPFDDWMPRSWNGVDCAKLTIISSRNKLPIYIATDPIGNELIDKGLMFYHDDYFAFNAESHHGWSVFPGPHGAAYIGMYKLPNYTLQTDIHFFARSIRQPLLISMDSIQIDLRTLPEGYGYTDKGEGIFIAFRADRHTYHDSTIFVNPMIHLTAPGDDISLDPIRSIPIEPLF